MGTSGRRGIVPSRPKQGKKFSGEDERTKGDLEIRTL
jgi:hypothetical protein